MSQLHRTQLWTLLSIGLSTWRNGASQISLWVTPACSAINCTFQIMQRCKSVTAVYVGKCKSVRVNSAHDLAMCSPPSWSSTSSNYCCIGM